jgi:ATP-dependent Clp protease ATP-binding subunit ClpX
MKHREEVRNLLAIAGHAVYICNECVGLCNDLIAEDDAKKVPALIELNGMSLLAFLQQYMQGRPVDSITVQELRDAIAAERERRLPRPPETTRTEER